MHKRLLPSWAFLLASIACLSAGCAPTLRLREVVLYQNGIGYFERSGSVQGSFGLRLAEHEVDDVIKTLTVVGADGSATLAAVIPNDPPPPQLAGDGTGEAPPVQARRTTDLQVRVGDGRQDVRVSYAVPTPSWGAVYRVVLPQEGEEALLQAWAVVHNASGEDWEDVSLTLATGSPFTYAVDLRTPRFVPRPDVTGNFVTPSIRGAISSTQSRGDGDGVDADDDLCPTEPEDMDGFQDEDGCPDPDNDGDRILDVDDQCPNDPETYNGTEDGDGCPDRGHVVVTESRLEILDMVYFTQGSARISPRSLPLVDAVAATLIGNPQITLVRVDGHATQGEPRASSLSRRRAEAVRDALIARGINASRLRVMSFGAGQPLGEAERNRRVSFMIDGQSDGPSGGASPSTGAPRPARPSSRPAPAPVVEPRISVASMSRRPSAVGLSADASDETRYALNAPVTIPSESSTLVAIVNERVAGSEVLLYRPDSNAPGSDSFPFRTARLQNDSGLQLVRGPVALFARGTFVGEGVLSALNAGERTFIPFAIDRSTRVSRRVERDQQPNRIVSIVRGVMSVTEWDVISTRYEVHAGARVPSRLVVHHNANAGYELLDPPRGTEVSGSAIVVPIDLSPSVETELTIEERRSRPERHALVHANVTSLEVYFSGDHLPAELRAQLAAVLAQRQAIAELDEELNDVRQQRSIQSRRLSELQSSLTAIERAGASAAQLRRDLQGRLREATSASEALTVQEAELAARRAEANVRLTESIAAITYDPETMM